MPFIKVCLNLVIIEWNRFLGIMREVDSFAMIKFNLANYTKDKVTWLKFCV